MSQPRQLSLGAFLIRNGHHVAGWRYPDNVLDDDPFAVYKEAALLAEAAHFDAVFFADALTAAAGCGAGAADPAQCAGCRHLAHRADRHGHHHL
ncbi:hypothetical protein [Methylobacillus glycogenes]|uniref:hypothetical protein n=1 Tax=Methylobacillus glycogenes TaxID=406 RepID=UPI001F39A352|nr:hypothetical protein [Methylobacillus glycogenes]